MGLPTHISSTGAEGTSIVKDGNFYATTLADDIAVQQLIINGGTAAGTPPAGWNTIHDSGASSFRQITIWKRCVVNEVTPTWTGVSGSARFFQSNIIRGCITSIDPFDPSLDGVDFTATAALSVPVGSTTNSDVLYLILIGIQNNATISSGADINLSTLTQRYNQSTASVSANCFTGGLAIAGPGGTLTGTISASRAHKVTIVPLLSTSTKPSGYDGKFFNFMNTYGL